MKTYFICLGVSLSVLVLAGCGPQTVSVPVHVLTPCPAQAPARSCGVTPPVTAQDLAALSESVIRLRNWGAGCQAEVTAWRGTHSDCLEGTEGAE